MGKVPIENYVFARNWACTEVAVILEEISPEKTQNAFLKLQRKSLVSSRLSPVHTSLRVLKTVGFLRFEDKIFRLSSKRRT